MALSDVRQDEEQFAPARTFLAERGVYADATGEYNEQDVIEAIRARGWEPTVTGTAGDWTVEFGERLEPTQNRYEVATGPDRAAVLLHALDLAATWLTREEARQLFDEQVRRLMGMSGEDFLRRWDAEELDPDNPSVRHLAILIPFGR